jgi:LytS/YehU family sensor histidine kinase
MDETRRTCMWGIGIGLLAGLHNIRTSGRILRACDISLLAAGVASAIAWRAITEERRRDVMNARAELQRLGAVR